MVKKLPSSLSSISVMGRPTPIVLIALGCLLLAFLGQMAIWQPASNLSPLSAQKTDNKSTAITINNPELPGDWRIMDRVGLRDAKAAPTDLEDISFASDKLRCTVRTSLNQIKAGAPGGDSFSQTRQDIYDRQIGSSNPDVVAAERFGFGQVELSTTLGMRPFVTQLVRQYLASRKALVYNEVAVLPRDARTVTVVSMTCPDLTTMSEAHLLMQRLTIFIPKTPQPSANDLALR